MTPEFLKAIADLLAAVAWPLIILFVVLLHRGAIARILGNLESFSLPGGIEGRIRQQVAEETRQVLEANPDAAKHVTEGQLQAAVRIQELAKRADVEPIRRQIRDLAHEYEATRAAMPSGHERTRKMEIVATKLRTLALAAEPLLPELVNSSSPGQRLAAAVTLQVRPRREYLGWLAERMRAETPFVGYHAAVAILSAARVLGGAERPALLEAIRAAKTGLGSTLSGSDRWKALEDAEREVGSSGISGTV